MTTTGKRKRIDWHAERDRIDLPAVATELLGPAPGRAGRGLWWRCPLGSHKDKNPSFLVDVGKGRWRCFGCGESGDAANLVMILKGCSFTEAIAYLTGQSAPSGSTKRVRKGCAPPAPPGPQSERLARPSGLLEAEALAFVVEAEARLWSPEGMDALAYLTGPRCLAIGTIRNARLGWTHGVRLATKDGRTYTARGWVVPWFDGDRLSLVKIRQPDGDRPKYVEAFRDQPSVYPGPGAIRPGHPLVIVEGEFDCLLLGQELDELAAVLTLGGTGSTKPEPSILGRFLTAFPWFVATDADTSGDKAASRWESTRARRVRPPEPYKDWTEARRAGVNLRRLWSDYLGLPFRPYSWEALAGWRWGPAVADPEPGIIIGRPDPARRRVALDASERSGEQSGA